jgi:hypothetical protein
MKTMGLIPDVLTSGEKFDIGLGSQENRRTLLSQFNNSPFNWAGSGPTNIAKDIRAPVLASSSR